MDEKIFTETYMMHIWIYIHQRLLYFGNLVFFRQLFLEYSVTAKCYRILQHIFFQLHFARIIWYASFQLRRNVLILIPLLVKTLLYQNHTQGFIYHMTIKS